MTLVSQDRLREILSYDPDTGVWTWLVTVGRGHCRRQAGSVAGCLRSDGYIVIGIDGRNYLAHQLAWFWMRNEWASLLDHEDTDRANNRWRNIRRATASLNQANRGAPKQNTTGVKGVTRLKNGKFVAKIQVNKKQITLGEKHTLDEAAALYAAAAQKYFGEFARIS